MSLGHPGSEIERERARHDDAVRRAAAARSIVAEREGEAGMPSRLANSLARRVGGVFRTRRVMILDGDRPARTLTLSSRLQAGAAVVALTTVGWASGAIVLVGARDGEIASTSAQLNATRAAYTALVDESMAQSIKIAEIVRSLSGYRSSLMAATDGDHGAAGGRSLPGQPEAALVETEASRRLKAELADIDVKLQGVSTRNELLRSDLDRMQSKVETTERERDAAMAQRLAVDERLRSLGHDLDQTRVALKEAERQLAERDEALNHLRVAKDTETQALVAARDAAVTDLRVTRDDDVGHARAERDGAVARLTMRWEGEVQALKEARQAALDRQASEHDAAVTDLRVANWDDVSHARAEREGAITRLTRARADELAGLADAQAFQSARAAAAGRARVELAAAADADRQARELAAREAAAAAAKLALNELIAAREMDKARAKVALDDAYAERDRLAERVSLTEQRMAALRAENEAAINHLADRTRTAINDVERVFTAAGLNPRQLAPQVDNRHPAGGGPFIPWADRPAAARVNSTQAASLMSDCDQLDQLRQVLRSVPLASPLAHFQVSGPFGFRHDPFNGRPAFHSGLDMLAPRDTPAAVTASGKVVTAGWDGDYGRLVEVDHGFGFHTRYAHLDQILVRVGQEVQAHDTVGLVGATGRAQAVHLHYEVTYKGVPHDPANFLKAVQNVLKAN